MGGVTSILLLINWIDWCLKLQNYSFERKSHEMLVAQELQPIILKFPNLTPKIIQLYNNDLNFKSLCEDYLLSLTLLHLINKNSQLDLALQNEYGTICKLLETEIREYLKK